MMTTALKRIACFAPMQSRCDRLRLVTTSLALAVALSPAVSLARADALSEGPGLAETVGFIAKYHALTPLWGGYHDGDLTYDFVQSGRSVFCAIFRNSVGHLTYSSCFDATLVNMAATESRKQSVEIFCANTNCITTYVQDWDYDKQPRFWKAERSLDLSTRAEDGEALFRATQHLLLLAGASNVKDPFK
jgi:hypothetical protein